VRSAGYKSLILITERGAGPTQAAASPATASDPLHISIDDSPSSLCDSKICAKYQSRINGPAFEFFWTVMLTWPPWGAVSWRATVR
jgi:hypothetical protein